MSLHPTQSTVSSSSHPASTYISKFKKIAVGIIFVFAAQMAMIPAQSYAAGCVESGAKAAITTGVVAGGLLFLDCLFGCPVSVATAGTTTAAAIAAMKAALLAALYGCADASLWGNPPPSPQPIR